jgi:hypothetical protein
MSDFQLDDISAGASQPDSPWIRYSVDLGSGSPGFALVNSTTVGELDDDALRGRVLDRLNELATAQGKQLLAAQLRSSGIRVHLTDLKAAG